MAPVTGRYPILESLDSPRALRDMDSSGLRSLAEEMRRALVDHVSVTGGHLGSSLGTVELTLALHAELDSPTDMITWDVGHQAYGHKLLTGRLNQFPTLRQHNGMSGFLRREESEHDIMGAGHASTSISYAVGLAEATRHQPKHPRVVAVIGDGALTGGMAYEGLNQAGALGSPIVVILNDNGMSISENVGAMTHLLQRVRLDPKLTRVREELERGLSRIPGVQGLGHALKDATKAIFVPGHLFEALGFAYMGPIDGHDIDALRAELRRAQDADRPVLIHAKTIKGRGYGPAEADGEAMHGVTPFVVESGKASRPSAGPPTYTEIFGKALVAEAERDDRVIAITAAMLKGTGVDHFRTHFPDRTFDVGIAEQHGVVFACGLALAGKKPVCAIYSTFLQRAFDPIVHDVAIQDLSVVFAIDRAGLVGDDGPTHHGAFDIAYLRSIPGLTLMAPMDEPELVDMLHTALSMGGPVAIRYPRGPGSGAVPEPLPRPVEVGRAEVLSEGERVALVGYGYGALLAREAAPLIAERIGTTPTVVNARFARPIDAELMRRLAAEHELIVTIEDHSVVGGFGSAVLEALDGRGRVLRIGLPDRFVDHGKRELLLAEVGLVPDQVADRVVAALGARTSV